MKPNNALAAPKMLKYMHVVRNLSERGGNWRGTMNHSGPLCVVRVGPGIA